ncbi:MAG: hypothetical protein RL660_3179 [Bacteroidota bacterium]|jgi:hypothetical protein
MKKIFLVALVVCQFVSNLAQAQNWRLIKPEKRQYFTVGEIDTFYEENFISGNQFSCIKCDSAQAINGGLDTIIYFPSTFYPVSSTFQSCLIEEPRWWTNSAAIVMQNGDVAFLSTENDTFLLKPHAQLGESWQCFKVDSTIGTAVVTSAIEVSSIGGVDSQKTISFSFTKLPQFFGFPPLQNSIVISKQHGIMTMEDLSNLPYQKGQRNNNVYIQLPDLQDSLDIGEDLAWRYQPGNWWQLMSQSGNTQGLIVQDSVLHSYAYGDAMVVYIHRTGTVAVPGTQTGNNNGGAYGGSSSGTVVVGNLDTFFADTIHAEMKFKLGELSYPDSMDLEYPWERQDNRPSGYKKPKFISRICNDLYVFSQTDVAKHTGGFYQWVATDSCIQVSLPIRLDANAMDSITSEFTFISKFGKTTDIEVSSLMPECMLVYGNLAGCEFGQKRDIFPLKSTILEVERNVQIVPQPSGTYANILLPTHLSAKLPKHCVLLNAVGAATSVDIDGTRIDLAHLPNGVYTLLLHLEGTSTIRKKICIAN